MRSRLLFAIVATILTVAVAGCSDEPDEPSPTIPSGETPVATSSPVLTTVAIPATATPGPGCPVDTTYCDFARTLLPILKAGDADALLRLGAPVEATCPSVGLGGPSPSLCAGASAGEKRSGYWDFQGGEGLIVPEADFRRTLERWFLSIGAAGGSDGWGPGELHIGSITCTRLAGAPHGDCDGQLVRLNFTFINSLQTPVDRGTGVPGQRITFFVQTSGSSDLKVRGFGTTVPPNSVLDSIAAGVANPGGPNSIIASYPWKP